MTRLLKPDANSNLAGLYLIVGPGLTPDPDHPGLYFVDGPGLTADPDHPGLFSIDPSEKDLPFFELAGYSQVEATLVAVPGTPVSVKDLVLDLAWTQGLVSATVRVRTDLHLDPVVGHSQTHIIQTHDLQLDTVRGVSAVSASMPQPHFVHTLLLDFVFGVSDVRVQRIPDLSRNAPILLGLSLGARLEALEPLVAT